MAFDTRKIYGVIGHPLGHSFSRTYFNNLFESEGIDAEYRNFDIPDIGDLMELIGEFPGLCGLNVTLPYKQLVIPYMKELSQEAREVNAVNVIKFLGNANDANLKLKGYNTDIYGFTESIRPLINPIREQALVLGTGGASRAICYGLEKLGVKPTLVSRTPREGVITYADLTPQVMAEHKVVVNCTPVGMYPCEDECPPIPYQYLTPEHLCYDLLYNPDVTLFMKRAKAQGAEVKNGLEMLLLQAFESWKIWNE